MKIYVHYDAEGNIHSVFSVDAAEGGGAMLAPEAGLFVGEVEIEGMELRSDQSNSETLLEIANTYKITTPVPRLQLAKKY